MKETLNYATQLSEATELQRHAIDPRSLAGILLREHDNAEQAIRYATRKAKLLMAMGNAVGLDYADAAKTLQAARNTR
jgi:hypothetical protein